MKNNYDFIFKLDDDIVNWTDLDKRVPKGDNILGIKRILTQLINDSIFAFDNIPRLGGVSLFYGNELYTELKKWYGENQRFQTAYIIRTSLFEPITGTDTFEDFAMTLNVIYNKYKILRYGLTSIRCEDIGSNAGGLQDFNRKHLALQAISILKDKFGPELKTRIKPHKAWYLEPILNSYSWCKSRKFK